MASEYKLDMIHCRLCKEELNKKDFKSVFEGEIHYKTTKCKCGKETIIPVKFSGSGHDDWKGQIEKEKAEQNTLDLRIMQAHD